MNDNLKATKEAVIGQIAGPETRPSPPKPGRVPLGTTITARFALIGLTEDLPELRGQPARPAVIAGD